MSVPEYRSPVADDHPGLCRLWANCAGLGGTLSAAGFASFVAVSGAYSCIALDGDQPVGSLLASFDGVRGAFSRLAVDPAWRGRGVARALFDRCSRALFAAGAEHLYFLIYGDNETGKRFWRAAGFHGVDNVEFWVMGRETVAQRKAAIG